MTEITAKTKERETYVIDPVAFFFSLICAPLSVAAGGFWLMGVPVIAAIVGGPFYLAIGVPVLLWYLGRYPPKPWRIAGLALISFAIPAVATLIYTYVAVSPRQAQQLLIFIGFGAVFAPLWGGIFGIYYRNFRREIYKRPI